MIVYQLAGRNGGPAGLYDKAEEMLHDAERCTVVNTRLLPNADPHDAAFYAVRSLLMDADALVMLPKWESSRLATLEMAVANATGMPVLDLEDVLDSPDMVLAVKEER